VCQCVNKVILIGFLGEAPELKFSPKGMPIGTFSLAVNERWKDTGGNLRERVEWFKIVCFGRLAEVCGEYGPTLEGAWRAKGLFTERCDGLGPGMRHG
jgi:single stranded DNA-binding protein